MCKGIYISKECIAFLKVRRSLFLCLTVHKVSLFCPDFWVRGNKWTHFFTFKYYYFLKMYANAVPSL